jgi:hypothetical protein
MTTTESAAHPFPPFLSPFLCGPANTQKKNEAAEINAATIAKKAAKKKTKKPPVSDAEDSEDNDDKASPTPRPREKAARKFPGK